MCCLQSLTFFCSIDLSIDAVSLGLLFLFEGSASVHNPSSSTEPAGATLVQRLTTMLPPSALSLSLQLPFQLLFGSGSAADIQLVLQTPSSKLN